MSRCSGGVVTQNYVLKDLRLIFLRRPEARLFPQKSVLYSQNCSYRRFFTLLGTEKAFLSY